MHLLMVLTMALWSPAWCCCGLRAALPDGAATASAATAEPSGCPFCAADSELDDAVAADEGCGTAPDSPSNCRCKLQGREALVKVDAWAQPSAPAPIAALPLLTPALMVADAPAPSWTVRGGGQRAAPVPTLLALHCMLTT